VFVWSDWDRPQFFSSYVKRYGEPKFSIFGDEDEALGKLRTGYRPDATQFCSYKINAFKAADVLQPIDVGRLSNWAGLVPYLKDLPEAVIEGNRYWVPNDWGTTAITYRADLCQPAEESWSLLWDERYSGRLAIFDSIVDGVMVAAIMAGAADPFAMNADEVARTEELLRRQRPLLRYYAASQTDVVNGLASGEIVAATTWQSGFALLAQQGLDVRFMRPRERPMTWVCGIGIVKDTPENKLDEVYALIDSVLSIETGLALIESFGHGAAQAASFDLASDELLASKGLARDPQAYLSSGILQRPVANQEELTMMFDRIKSGL
jgi:spermidine/putrescine transport system substrate-binding protein